MHSLTYLIFSLSSEALLLAMIAIGACHLSEHDLSAKAYEASCVLLSQVS